jgi:glucose/arabinose dehydrogenase
MDPAIRQNPQRLDTLGGKILRIIPDLDEHNGASAVGRYRIPNDNPFVSLPGAQKEIWAYGLRNPNRLSWYFDPANPGHNTLFATVVGLHTWETIDIIQKGANYGYSLREGNEQLNANNETSELPDVDKIPMLVGATTVAPITEEAYHARGGKEAGLPGRAVISGGRSDIHFCMDRNGELYILSKSDGMIRAVVGAASH